MDKTLHDYDQSGHSLFHLIKSYDEGFKGSYRMIAVELRKLLCDKKNSLLPRAKPHIKLHKLSSTEMRERFGEGLTFMLPGLFEGGGSGNYSYELLFAQSGEMMSVEDWINQPLFNNELTINELIKSVADKEGAHSDKDYNDTLTLAKSVKLVTDDLHIPGVVSIAKYIYEIMWCDKNNKPFTIAPLSDHDKVL